MYCGIPTRGVNTPPLFPGTRVGVVFLSCLLSDYNTSNGALVENTLFNGVPFAGFLFGLFFMFLEVEI